MDTLAQRIDDLLPQTQCRKCGFDGCRPYAQAMAAGTAPINRCPPGGQAGIARLAALLQTAELPLDTRFGSESPAMLAVIDESHCIGCTLCIMACPVDAIVGAAKRMHTILLSHCTGCELCVRPCPVDCIELTPLQLLANQGVQGARVRATLNREACAREARQRFMAQRLRLSKGSGGDSRESESDANPERGRRRQLIEQAIARARQRRRAADGA